MKKLIERLLNGAPAGTICFDSMKSGHEPSVTIISQRTVVSEDCANHILLLIC